MVIKKKISYFFINKRCSFMLELKYDESFSNVKFKIILPLYLDLSLELKDFSWKLTSSPMIITFSMWELSMLLGQVNRVKLPSFPPEVLSPLYLLRYPKHFHTFPSTIQRRHPQRQLLKGSKLLAWEPKNMPGQDVSFIFLV